MRPLSFRVGVDDKTVQRFIDSVADAFSFLQSLAILDGNLLTGVSLVNGTNDVSHKLGREPLGYIVVKKNGFCNIWDMQDANPSTKNLLRLAVTGIASGMNNVTVSLWVF